LLTASVPWLRLFVVGIPPLGHEFDTGPVDVIFVIHKLSVGVGIL
jgi:hypothetical protein